MALSIKRTLGNGVAKTLTKAALTFVILIGLIQLMFIASTNTVFEAFIASLDLPAGASATSTSFPLSLPVSATIAGVLALGTLLLLQAITVVLIRVMAADRQVITRETYTRRMIWVVLNSIIAGIVVGLLTMVGFVLLIIPGLFLMVSLLFTTVYIADQDENVLSAIQDSWSLASGNRWRLFGMYVVILVGFFIISFAAGFILPAGSVLSTVVSMIINTIMIVYMMAVITDAYRQLFHEDRSGQGGESSPDITTSLS